MGTSPLKKVGPAVPPKPKKPQPQVPKSYQLSGACEPSYSVPLQTAAPETKRSGTNSGPVYSNILPVTASEPGDNVYSNIEPTMPMQHLYSNLEPYSKTHIIDDLPPPPPEPADYGTCGANLSDEFPPPPSPVSSSYSELRRATNYQPDFGTYAPPSQGSSTYESIYEPINPRPPSTMSNYSLYAPYGKRQPSGAPVEESEVDALTDLLVQSMNSSSADSDTYGECSECGGRIIDEGSGCSALDKMYHVSCFTCAHCGIQLQGKPFYALEGKPYCKQGYLDTLEKCSVCLSPILDRILRATGRPYHPKCFCCVVCGKSLDGIPFTVDATNQIHCIEDFHKKFAPRCCVCNLPIMPEPGQDETIRVVALDRSFHTKCYKCEDCGLVLSSEAEGRGCYPLDDHILCKSCNARRVQELSSGIFVQSF